MSVPLNLPHRKHLDLHVHRVGSSAKFMLVRMLDELEIDGCSICENLRYNLIAWFHSDPEYQLEKEIQAMDNQIIVSRRQVRGYTPHNHAKD